MWTRMVIALRKSGAVLVPALIMLLFALLLNTGQILKRPLGQGDDIPGSLQRLEASILAEDWPDAGQHLTRLTGAMAVVRPRIELASERSELTRFNETVALLQGSLRARDLSSSLQHVALLSLIYDGLGR